MKKSVYDFPASRTLQISNQENRHSVVGIFEQETFQRFQWKRSADRSKEVPTTLGSEALKEVPASEALRLASLHFFRLF